MKKVNKITVRRDLIAAIAKWTCTDEHRPHLGRVLFDKTCYVATDGHRLVRVPTESSMEPFCIDRTDIFAAVAAAKELGTARIDISTDTEGCAFLSVGSGSVLRVKMRDASEFPPYKQAIPKRSGASQPPNGIIMQPRYLAPISEVVAASEDDGIGSGVELTGWGPEVDGGYLDPLMFTSRSGIVFVIMPMRAK